MLRIRRSKDRGHANHGWLDAYHSFSFADYYDPRFMGFGPLRVLNQDRIAPGSGFGMHGHSDMEIVTWVLDGVLEHRDSMGHGAQMRHGDVQFMSAGTGVMHSEFNPSADEELHLLQMWVLPRHGGGVPRYAQRAVPLDDVRGTVHTIVASDADESAGDDVVPIGQDAQMAVGILEPGDEVSHHLGDVAAWLHLARGAITLGGETLEAGDSVAILDERDVQIAAAAASEFIVWQFDRDLV